MIDEQIIKALECCTTDTARCMFCPYFVPSNGGVCFVILHKDALDLIRRQGQVEGEWETGLQTCSYLSGTDAEYCCKCNVCGGFAVDAFAYCPNCGAKMKGGTE